MLNAKICELNQKELSKISGGMLLPSWGIGLLDLATSLSIAGAFGVIAGSRTNVPFGTLIGFTGGMLGFGGVGIANEVATYLDKKDKKD